MSLNQYVSLNFGIRTTAVVPKPAPLHVRAAQAGDAKWVIQMHERLSDESLYRRYHGSRLPTVAEFEKICALGGKNGRCFLAFLSESDPQLVGMAYYVTYSTQSAAEVALLVDDTFQGKGIGRKLMNRLVHSAVRNHIEQFIGYIHTSNHAMIHLFKSSGALIENYIEYGSAEMCIQLGRA